MAGFQTCCNILAIDAGKESRSDRWERDTKLDESDAKSVKSILVNQETSKVSHTKQIIRIRAFEYWDLDALWRLLCRYQISGSVATQSVGKPSL